MDAKKVSCRCVCGFERNIRYTDLRRGNTKSCKSCSGTERMAIALQRDRGKVLASLKKASDKAKALAKSKYSAEEARIVGLMGSAKNRCKNPKSSSYENYGGRGIEFGFPDIETAARWVMKNLGARPAGKSIDRIDNDRGYEPGNLRWATREEQARNKRAYRGCTYGYRLINLVRLRPDYTYEGLRKYIRLGYTDEQILSMEKPKGGRKRKC